MDLNHAFSIVKKRLENLPDEPKKDFRLEQAELKKDDDTWEIIVSYLLKRNNEENPETTNLLGNIIPPFERIYKLVKINNLGEIIGFYIFNNK